MVSSIINNTKRNSSKRNYLIIISLFIITEILINFLFIPGIKQASGGKDILDSLFMTSFENYIIIIESYNSKARLLHYFLTSIDMILPLIYGSLFMFVFVTLKGKLLKSYTILTMATVLFDYAENMGILFSISHYNMLNKFLITYLQIFSNLKFIFLGFITVSAIIILFRILFKSINKTNNK